MRQAMINRKGGMTTSQLVIISFGAVSSLYAGVNYYKAWKGPELQPLPKDYCFRCHSDEKTLRMMKMKAGDDETDPHYKAKIISAKLDVMKKPVFPQR